MAIFTKNQFASDCFVSFFERNAANELHPVFDLAAPVIKAYCDITNSRCFPFIPGLSREVTSKHDIQLLAREFFLCSAYIARCSFLAEHIAPLIGAYLPDMPAKQEAAYDAAVDNLRQDWAETAAFRGTQLLLVAKRGNTLVIDGL